MNRILEWFSGMVEFLRVHLAWPIHGWLVFFSPTLLAVCVSAMPSMLGGFLILRTESRRDFFWDLLCLSTASLVVSAMGGAMVRLYDLYACLRFKYAEQQIDLHRMNSVRRTDWLWWSADSSAWPMTMIVAWLIVSGYLPFRAYLASTTSLGSADPQAADQLWGNSGLDTFYVPFVVALACASLWFLFVSIVQLSWARIRGRDTAACGILPLEDVAAWLLELCLGKASNSVHRPVHWLWVSPGFTEPNSRKILPGHLQVFAMFTLATLFYVYLFVSSYGGSKWPQQWYPVGIYAMLILFLAGSGLGWFVFLLGRYRVRLWIIAALGLLLVFLLGQRVGFDTNRYYVLSPHRNDSLMVAARADEAPLPTFLNCLNDQDTSQDYARRRSLFEIYSQEPKWVFPKDSKGKSTMVVVTASGGGIQAAAWTAQVLVGMDEKCPKFSESIGLISAVSGGSVGAMYYVGHRPFRFNDGEHSLQLTHAQRDRIVHVAGDSCLESVGWGLAFPDLARSIFPFPIWDSEIDRGWALESRWWNRMGRDEDDAAIMKELRMRDLVRPANRGHVPPLIFNATAVETGQRVMIANFLTNQEMHADENLEKLVDASSSLNESNAVKVIKSENSVSYDRPTTPIDLLDFYEPLHVDKNDVNPRISTSVRLSASFAYVTPVARPLVARDRLKPGVQDQDLGKRLNLHLCDGGYSDNTGLVATIHLIAEMLEEFRAKKVKPPFDRILFFNIESFPENTVLVENDTTGLSSGFFGPASALANARVSSQAERALLELTLLKQSYGRAFGKSDDRQKLSVFEANQNSFNEYDDAVRGMQEAAGKILQTINESDKKDDVSDIANGLESMTKHEKIYDASSPDSTWGKISRTKNFADQFQSVSDEWKEQIGTAISSETKAMVTLLHEKAKVVSDLASKLPTKPAGEFALDIEIGSIEMRFNPGLDCNEAADSLPSKGKIETPPLSWMLSPHDKHRLMEAWKAKTCLFLSSQQLANARKNSGPVAASSEQSSESKAATPPTTGLSKFQSVSIAPETLGDFLQVSE